MPDSLGFARLGRRTPDIGNQWALLGGTWDTQDSLQLAPARQWRTVFSPESGQLLLHLPSSRKATSLVKDAPTHTPGAPSCATNFPTPDLSFGCRIP